MAVSAGFASGLDQPGQPAIRFYHTDMIGTTRLITGVSGTVQDEAVYTAFGEPVSVPDYRCGYAGR